MAMSLALDSVDVMSGGHKAGNLPYFTREYDSKFHLPSILISNVMVQIFYQAHANKIQGSLRMC